MAGPTVSALTVAPANALAAASGSALSPGPGQSTDARAFAANCPVARSSDFRTAGSPATLEIRTSRPPLKADGFDFASGAFPLRGIGQRSLVSSVAPGPG